MKSLSAVWLYMAGKIYNILNAQCLREGGYDKFSLVSVGRWTFVLEKLRVQGAKCALSVKFRWGQLLFEDKGKETIA